MRGFDGTARVLIMRRVVGRRMAFLVVALMLAACGGGGAAGRATASDTGAGNPGPSDGG
jgi:hypothetical protein